jgi:hypothetical protein
MGNGRILIIIAAALVCLASASAKKYETQSESVEGVSDDDLFTAAVRVLADEGFSFRLKDREAGEVATEWQDVSIGGTSYHHAWRVSVAGGEVILKIDCEMQVDDLGGKKWVKCGDARHEDWVSKAPDLLSRIKNEARDHAGESHTKEPEPKAEPEAARPADGTEGGKCYGNGTCNQGLTCASNLCVVLPSEEAPATQP